MHLRCSWRSCGGGYVSKQTGRRPQSYYVSKLPGEGLQSKYATVSPSRACLLFTYVSEWTFAFQNRRCCVLPLRVAFNIIPSSARKLSEVAPSAKRSAVVIHKRGIQERRSHREVNDGFYF